MTHFFRCLVGLLLCLPPLAGGAQDLTLATVTRPPFSMVEDGEETGFAIDLWRALAEDLGWDYEIRRVGSFPDMLGLIERGEAHAAIANISITADRELVMDFSQPIFEAGLQIMVPADDSTRSVWSLILSRDLLVDMFAAFCLLFACGMLMWYFERRKQPYFDMPVRHAMFPAFWWALNLVVNGGFEERQPRSLLGRLFGVVLVISSLFVVSIFVARITTLLTIDAIQSNVNGLNDLYGRQVGTIGSSTSAAFLDRRDLRYVSFDTPAALFGAFEEGRIDAVVYDAPLLAHYVNTAGQGEARLIGQIFLPENYGIALPSNSPYANALNHSLLKLREDGTYDTIYRKWFGAK
ncbi:transporter substrate-binding domain-containing protein [Celeribacter indicus]|uniref:Glutamine ABC transporter substrate-binding protein n=1 Tax=Celeribacter indicus TaxID=1208324 RepID=A0A0B5DU62_9RHOB|nr:transporter substrate-binding domain-containing protein [Celeribacter indicus]AJE44765.1 glutamine ABC transporter substrate-binding protein [Celeribacter indicus]SDX46433.1 amino acid ABC transporter substrate-binding protein, PAAT family [Celeribacter indicus]